MADFISTQDLINVKQDIEDIGLSVNTDGIITPRYGAAYDSLPKVIREMIEQKNLKLAELQTAIDTAVAAGVGAAGWYSYLVVHDNGETQKQINDYNGVTWYARVGGYGVNDKARLSTGEIVISTISSNTNNPNSNMTGWVFAGDSVYASVADVLAIPSPKNGQIVNTVSYIAGKSIGGNQYKYISSRQLENDGGSVINGWVVQDKGALTVWDFGYVTDNATAATIALTKCIQSDFPTKLTAENLNYHNYVNISRSGNKVITGVVSKQSLLTSVRIALSDGSYILNNFKIQKNGLNYGIYISSYEQLYVEDYECEECYDALCITTALTETSKAVVKNATAIKAARIGFTSDLGAKNVTYINCKVFDSRQAFHGELCENILYKYCVAQRCGNSAPTPTTDQPTIYAGGFRFHYYKDVTLIGCKNLNPAGANIDWLGGGGSNLILRDCEGIGFETDDVSNGQPIASFTFTDIYADNCKGFSIVNTLTKSIMSGVMSFENLTDAGRIELTGGGNYGAYPNLVSLFNVKDVKAGRIQCNTSSAYSVCAMDNVLSESQYYNSIAGFYFYELGDIKYNWLTGDESQYPTIGYRFGATNARTFNLKSFTSIGRGGGSQLSLEGGVVGTLKGGTIGMVTCSGGVIDAFLGVNFDSFNIIYAGNSASTSSGNIQSKSISTTTASLSSASNVLNVYGKYAGKPVFNSTINKVMYATGSSTTSTWVATDNSSTITPS